MRRSTFAIGLLLILAGILILNRGSQVLTPVAEVLGLASHVQTENALIAPTLLTVPPSNYTFLPAVLKAGSGVRGALQVGGGGEIAFYVMDEASFSEWRSGQPSTVILAKPLAISYNFTFTPAATGTYYFVFDNQDAGRRTVLFTLDIVSNVVVLSPIVEYAGYGMLTIGLLLSILAAKTGGKKSRPRERTLPHWECKFCGAANVGDEKFCEKCGRSQT